MREHSNAVATTQTWQFDLVGWKGRSGSGRRPEPKKTPSATNEAYHSLF